MNFCIGHMKTNAWDFFFLKMHEFSLKTMDEKNALFLREFSE